MLSKLRPGGRLVRRLVAVVIVTTLAVATTLIVTNPGTRTAVAYFDSVKHLYGGDKVKILGIEVGEITAVVPQDDRVRVEFEYDAEQTLPADVNAVIVSPTLVSTRFLQLDPPYKGGAELRDGATIPRQRTATPLEYDDLKEQLAKVSNDLGPGGINEQGALNEFLDVGAANAKGNGEAFRKMVGELSSAVQTLSEGRGDIFGTVKNLQILMSALAGMDKQLASFNKRLGGVGDLLHDNSGELAGALGQIQRAGSEVTRFLRKNRGELSANVSGLAELTRTLAQQRDNLATILHVGPNTLTNFFNIFSPRAPAYTGSLVVDSAMTPADLVCGAMAVQAAQDAQRGQQWCASYLGPLLNVLRINALPGGVRALTMDGGGRPTDQPPPGRPDRPEDPDTGLQVPELPGVGGLLVPQQGTQRQPGIGGLLPSGGNR